MDLTCIRPSRPEPTPTSDDSRAFLQERLAYLGRVYASIGISFYVIGNLIALAAQAQARRLLDIETWLVPAACLLYFTQWMLCRRGVLTLPWLRAIDSTTTVLAAALGALMMFTTMPGDVPGMSYTRALLLISFGLLARAVLVPSSARRTFTLGAIAALAAAAIANLWHAAQPPAHMSLPLHTVMTGLWILGAGVIATLASHVTFGLRREVKEARRFGQYTLIEKVGEGGMGAVYRANHAMLKRPTAIKLLRADQAGTDRVRRFEREVQLTSQLTHQNTISIFDYGRTPDGIFYYAMEYLDGLNLEELVRMDGPQPAARVAHILRQVASSLAEAHEIGLVHRDVKPSNVILVPARAGAHDVAKVVDFGLVKELDTDAGLTREGRLAGTPHYLAPEALTSPGQISAQSDLYALGCVGYFLLTGQRVFEGRSIIDVCSQHLSTPPIPPAERLGAPVTAGLSNVVMTCLEKAPERRPASAVELVAMLDDAGDAAAWTADDARAWWTHRRHERAVPVDRSNHRTIAPATIGSSAVDLASYRAAAR